MIAGILRVRVRGVAHWSASLDPLRNSGLKPRGFAIGCFVSDAVPGCRDVCHKDSPDRWGVSSKLLGSGAG